jgi:hypothetical protein
MAITMFTININFEERECGLKWFRMDFSGVSTAFKLQIPHRREIYSQGE